MIRIAIVDDENEDRKALKDEAIQNFKERKIPLAISEFNDGEKLLNYIELGGGFDIIFLDIYLKKNGIETAKALRERGIKSRIVFVTNSKLHALDAFSVYATGYLVKPLDPLKFDSIITQILLDLKKENISCNKQLLVKSKGSTFTVPYDKILSIESSLKKVNLFLEGGVVHECSDITLTQIFEKLDDNRFLRCHNSFIVNMDKIIKVTNSYFTLIGGRTADITKRHYATVKRKYFSYLSK